MRGDTEQYVVESPRTPAYELENRDSSTVSAWPAQLVGGIIGIGITVLGFAAIARTGFDTDHIYTPRTIVWRLPHSPLMALIEVGFGVLLILAAVVPGGMRAFMAALGAAALSFGLVVLAEPVPNRLNHWLGVTDHNGWVFTVVGGVVLLAALISLIFTSRTHRHVTREEYVSSGDSGPGDGV